MRRLLLSVLVLAAALSTQHDAVAGGLRPEDERWVALNVSPSGRVLVVQAIGGGCGHDPYASTAESRDAVEIHVLQLVPTDPGAICPSIARIDTIRVRLSSPIAGRALVRQTLTSATAVPAGPRTMPRMVGLRAADARFALRAQGFRVRGDRGGTVSSQRPRPLAPLPAGRVTATLAAA